MTIKRKIERILALTMEISPPDVKYNYEEKPVVFFTYSGHCPCLRVDVCENGWKHGADSTQRFTVFNLDSKKHAKEVHQQLDMIISYLEKLRRR